MHWNSSRIYNWYTYGSYIVDMFENDDNVVKLLPIYDSLLPFFNVSENKCFEIIIEFLSSGYWIPRSVYGGLDGLGWPEESHDERILWDAYLLIDGEKVKLSDEIQHKLFDFYEEEVYDVELET